MFVSFWLVVLQSLSHSVISTVKSDTNALSERFMFTLGGAFRFATRSSSL